MFERVRKWIAHKRRANFFTELTWQGYCLLFGGAMFIAGLLAVIGIYPTTPEDAIGFDAGFFIGIILLVVGVFKR